MLAALTACTEESNTEGEGTGTTATSATTAPDGEVTTAATTADNSGDNAPTADFDSAEELGNALLAKANENLEENDQFPTGTLPPLDDAPVIVRGLTEAQHNNYVTDVDHRLNLIMAFPEVFVVISENDADATRVATLVAAGYDPEHAICVRPDRVSVARIGRYVLVIAATADQVEALVNAFNEIVGGTADVNTFYELDPNDDGGFGLDPDGDGGFGFGGGMDIGIV
jgi:hypothetical protein